MNDLEIYCPKCGDIVAKNDNLEVNVYCTNSSCDYSAKLGTNGIDIGFRCKGVAKALSNLCPYRFTFEGIQCASMESFIQSLKEPDSDSQKYICSLSGPFLNTIKKTLNDWREKQNVYWQGFPIDRHSKSYTLLLKAAFRSLYEQAPLFRMALAKSKGCELFHTIGCTDPHETLLTPNEYISILNDLRDCYLK